MLPPWRGSSHLSLLGCCCCFFFQPQPNQDDPSLMCPEVNLVLIILKVISGSLSPRQLQIPINVTVNIKHGRWNLSCCSVGSQNVFTEVHPSSSWSLGLLVAGLSPGLSFYNEDPLMNFILYILTGWLIQFGIFSQLLSHFQVAFPTMKTSYWNWWHFCFLLYWWRTDSVLNPPPFPSLPPLCFIIVSLVHSQ